LGASRNRCPVFISARLEHEDQRPISKPPDQIIAELTAFLRSFCQQIGNGELVDPIVVDNWNPEPVPPQMPEAAPV